MKAMGDVKTPPIKVFASLVKRNNGAKAISKTFRGRIPFQLFIKLAAWLIAYGDQYPKEQYKLMVYIEPADDPRAVKLKELLKNSGVTVVDEVIQNVV